MWIQADFLIIIQRLNPTYFFYLRYLSQGYAPLNRYHLIRLMRRCFIMSSPPNRRPIIRGSAQVFSHPSSIRRRRRNDPLKKLLRVNVNELLLHCTVWWVFFSIFPQHFSPRPKLQKFFLYVYYVGNNSIYFQVLSNKLTPFGVISRIILPNNLDSSPATSSLPKLGETWK